MPEPSRPDGARFRPLGPLARAAQAVLAVHVLVKAVFLGSVALAAAGRAPAELSAALHTLDRIAWGFVPLALLFPALLARRALANLRWLGEPGLLHGPNRAAAVFFVPVMQVQAGYAVLEELWERTARAAGEPEEATLAELLRVARFWRLFVLGALVTYVATRLLAMPLVPELGVLAALALGLGMQLFADVDGLRLLGRLRARHDALGR